MENMKTRSPPVSAVGFHYVATKENSREEIYDTKRKTVFAQTVSFYTVSSCNGRGITF
jgi:hypothetical protein